MCASHGARLSGLLGTYPLFGTVPAVFAHRLSGPAAAERVLRGALIGLFGNTAFFRLLALMLERFGVAAAFTAATALVFLVQAGTLLVRRPSRPLGTSPTGD